jgi:LPXTG-motif cell wall-anchored protein
MDKFLETANAKNKSSSIGTGAIIGIVLGVIGVIGAAIVGYIYYKRKNGKKDNVFA